MAAALVWVVPLASVMRCGVHNAASCRDMQIHETLTAGAGGRSKRAVLEFAILANSRLILCLNHALYDCVPGHGLLRPHVRGRVQRVHVHVVCGTELGRRFSRKIAIGALGLFRVSAARQPLRP